MFGTFQRLPFLKSSKVVKSSSSFLPPPPPPPQTPPTPVFQDNWSAEPLGPERTLLEIPPKSVQCLAAGEHSAVRCRAIIKSNRQTD